MALPNRKRNRLANYNYSLPGAYFITICTENRHPILGEVVGGGAFDAPHIKLTECGKIIENCIISGNRIPGVVVEKYIIMPNHIHLLILVEQNISNGTSKAPSPTNAVIPHFVSTFKRFCHQELGKKVFQRSYHDHIIRGEKDYMKIWEYIDTNPARWKDDCFYIEE